MNSPIYEKPGASRIALGIEYDGSSYHGWQKQSNANSVQAELERALSEVANHTVELTCAGRTDTAVHALGQVVHFDCLNPRPEKAWLKGANSLLPASISIRFAKTVSSDFHARFSATSRSYLYIIDNRKVKPAIFEQGLTWWDKHLDTVKMNRACQYFLGEQDFSSFRSSQCQSNSPNRCITEISCHRSDQFVAVKVTANAFLHHMVRNIVGLLIEIGDGRKEVEWAKSVIDARDRNASGVTAKPNGLYLVAVDYPTLFELPKIVEKPLYFNSFI